MPIVRPFECAELGDYIIEDVFARSHGRPSFFRCSVEERRYLVQLLDEFEHGGEWIQCWLAIDVTSMLRAIEKDGYHLTDLWDRPGTDDGLWIDTTTSGEPTRSRRVKLSSLPRDYYAGGE